MADNLLGTIRLPISLSRSKHRIAALRQFRLLQYLSPIPDHFLQRDLEEAALRRTLRVAGQVPITSHKKTLVITGFWETNLVALSRHGLDMMIS